MSENLRSDDEYKDDDSRNILSCPSFHASEDLRPAAMWVINHRDRFSPEIVELSFEIHPWIKDLET